MAALYGRVTVDTLGAAKRVAVLDRITWAVVAETTSAEDGTWAVEGLAESVDDNGLVVLALDDSGTYNAETYDHVRTVAE